MNLNNMYYQVNVLTDKGIVKSSQLYPGDKVYSFIVDKKSQYDDKIIRTKLEVADVKSIYHDEIIKIIYSDGREQIIGNNDKIYIGDTLSIDAYKIFGQLCTGVLLHDIKIEYPIFEFNIIKNPLNPNPYLAGIILFYEGFFNKPNLSLPTHIRNRLENILAQFNYNTDYFNIKYNKIIWDELFKDYHFYAKTKNPNDPLIPYKYQYASYKDRLKFIKGIFDVGYDIITYPYHNCICSKNEEMLKCLKNILLSMGIPSTIEFVDICKSYDNPFLHCNDNPYVLFTNNGNLDFLKYDYPGYYYDIDYIEKKIKNYENIIMSNKQNQHNFSIKEMILIGHGYIDNIIFNNVKNAIYTSENYLPRVSL